MRQATLVAHYGSKPGALADLIRSCQELLKARAGTCFHPYSMDQVHATLIGMERADGRFNRNFADHRGERKSMDVLGYLEFLQTPGALPFEAQFGGFADRDFPFTSRCKRPFDRSFSIQGDKAVIIGWPVRRDPPAYPDTLDALRQRAEGFGILHSWHRKPGDVDNDLYLRLGLFDPIPDAVTASSLEREVRDMLAAAAPTMVEVGATDLRVVSYLDETLPLTSSVSSPIGDIRFNDCFDSLLAGVPPEGGDGCLVLATTPRRSRLDRIDAFLKFGREWRKVDPRIILMVAMPSQCSEQLRQTIAGMLHPEDGECMTEMSPPAGPLVGHIFKGAAAAAFQLPNARAFLHVPNDLDFGNSRCNDVQDHIREFGALLDGNGPALLVGDYGPGVWVDGAAARHLSKELIGKAVWKQFAHYGLDPGFGESSLRQLRSEFFGCKRYFFESADAADVFAPYDPVPFLLLHAADQGFPAEIRDLGIFYEAVAGKPDASRVHWQLIRFAEQAANAYLARHSVADPAAALARAPDWRNAVAKGMQMAFDDLDDILRKLRN